MPTERTSLSLGGVKVETVTTVSVEPGIHNLTRRDYLRAEGVGASFLANMEARCPYFAQVEHEKLLREIESGVATERWTTQERGTALHAFEGEPATFRSSYVVDDGNRRTKEVRERIAERAKAGVVSIKTEHQREIEAMHAALMRNTEMADLLVNAEYREVTVVWVDNATGLLCKARLDFVHLGSEAIWDLKTMPSVAEHALQRAMVERNMHMQAAHHLNGARACGLKVSHFGWLAVENKPPHLTRVVRELDEESFGIGQTLVADRLADYAACARRGTWPGYPGGILALPEWYLKRYRTPIDFSGVPLETEEDDG